MAKRTIAELSRTRLFANSDTTYLTEEAVAGSLQRIADATELMAKTRIALEEERDMWKKAADVWEDYYHKESLSNRSLRGAITTLKKRLNAANKEKK